MNVLEQVLGLQKVEQEEIAMDPPGFAVDEQPDVLGEKLMLPEWFEANRTEIEKGLSPIQVRVME